MEDGYGFPQAVAFTGAGWLTLRPLHCVFCSRYVLPNHMMLKIAEELPK